MGRLRNILLHYQCHSNRDILEPRIDRFRRVRKKSFLRICSPRWLPPILLGTPLGERGCFGEALGCSSSRAGQLPPRLVPPQLCPFPVRRRRPGLPMSLLGGGRGLPTGGILQRVESAQPRDRAKSLLDLACDPLCRGHATLFCVVPILTDCVHLVPLSAFNCLHFSVCTCQPLQVHANLMYRSKFNG